MARSGADAVGDPVIVWDLGGVVATFDPDARLAALAGASGSPAAHIEQAIWHSGLDAEAEQGLIDEEAVWSRVLIALDHTLSRAEIRRCWALAFVADPAVLALVDRLAGPAGLFTDNGPILAECLRNELRSLADRFAPILLSCQLQATKRDPVAFQRASELLGVDPSDLTLIDDRLTNVQAARTAGWRAIQFETVDALEQSLGCAG